MKNATLKNRGILLALVCLTLFLEACANTTPGKYTKILNDAQAAELQSWRFWMGLIIGVQYIMMLYATHKTRDQNRFGGLILNLVGVPFLWSKLGEWAYRLTAWIFGWGLVGKIFLVVGGGLSGGFGVGNLGLYILAGFLFKNVELLKYGVLPSLVSSMIFNLYIFSKIKES